MYQEIEVQSEEIIIANFHLRIFDKDRQKVISNKYIINEELGRKLFNEQVKVYHNMPIRVIISLYDLEKCTNIEYYDTDDNI